MHSKQGTTSLTVRARRHQDESKAERMFQNIIKHCKKVGIFSSLRELFFRSLE